ncbi:sialoadhesin-like isoform X1 [Ctenopharyngodon idella]|uniref:sialoadhesin-like isoform X1 n=1 Tax=Ctenopharyngodon idella TaxID=7959 RepID=UPI00222FBD20|nr:sialoadhesin-like isoform X1 [Ctenopharyngodon idella]
MELSQLPLVLLLISNIHSGHTEVKVQLSVSPQKWLTEGDPVTLICEVKGSSTGWTFSWFTETVTDSSDFKDRYKLLSDSSRGAGGKYTVSSATVNHTGVYVCGAEREKTAYKSLYSNTQPLWVTAVIVLSGVSPPVSLIISPSRTQHFKLVSLSLSCEDQSNSDGWTVRRYTDSWGWLEDCSLSRWGSQTGSTCTISSTIPEDTGVYWCQSESGEKYHPVNITVQTAVILESPVHPVTEGDTLTLRCLYQFPPPSILRADFYKDGSLIQNQTTEMIISTVSKSHEGFYYCKHPERGESPKSWISVRAAVILESPVHPVTEGDSLTLRCLYQHRNPSILRADFYKDGSLIQNQTTEMIISTVSKSHEGFYYCKHPERGESLKSWISVRVKVQLSVSPQKWLTEGDPVTLICEVNGSSTGWTFSWFTETETVSSGSKDHYKLLSDSSRGAGGKYTVSSAAVNHTGVYVCGAEREKTAYKTHSNKQPLWVTGVSPPVSLIISPSRTQHFSSVSLSLSCKDQSNSDGWTVRRYTDRWGLEDCSSPVFGSQTGSTCTINTTIPSHTGVYWCQSESGEKYHPVNITVQIVAGVILESPVHPVTEGDNLTLRCLDKFADPLILRADFYKDGSLFQNQTTEMIISNVSKSHEGFYYCKHPEIGESLKSWISVRVGVILESPVHPVTEGDSLTLRCLYKHPNPSNPRADFYKDGSLIQNQTTEMIISTVSKSHEGFYYCKHPETKKESTKSWISVRERPKPKVIIKPDQHVFSGETVTLRCDIDVERVTRWRFNWYKEGSTSVFSELQEHTFRSVNESDAGKYSCNGSDTEGSRRSNISDEVTLTVSVGVILESPVHPVTEGDTLTLRCLYQFATPSILRADFYKDGSLIQNQTTEMIISTVSKSHEGFYYCKHPERGESPKSWISVRAGVILESPVHPVTEGDTLTLRCLDKFTNPSILRADFYKDGSLIQNQTTEMIISTVSKSHEGFYYCKHPEEGESPKRWISVRAGVILESPVHPVTEGDTLTLRCLYQFPPPSILRADFYKDGSLIQNQTTEMIISTVSKSHEGFYYCKHPEEGESPKSWISVRERPKPKVIIKPDQHVFSGETVTLRCDIDVEGVTRWRYNWYKEGSTSVFSELQEHTFRSVNESDAGKYSCNGSDTEGSRRSNISDEVTLTVSVGVILESPVHPVTEGDTLTLRCLNKSATPSIVRADFYKDGSLIQSQTTEMIISTVSKSHEGFYYCKHPERGESPKSWISVRASGSDGLIIGVTVGLTAVFLIVVFLVLLWRFRNNKGGRPESPSAVSQQQNISQTSEQNQSEAGYNTPLSGTAHVYDSVAINKDISTDGVSEITYAEVELKSTNKQKKEKENKDKNTESCDVLYSKLKLETDQGAGSSEATYAQVK